MELVAIIIALIVPIGVAIWTVRSSAKDTAKQIAALEESTTKQIESIKELARLQMDASIKQVELEIEKNLKDSVMKQFQEQKPERDYHLYSKFINELEAIKQNLEANKKKMD